MTARQDGSPAPGTRPCLLGDPAQFSSSYQPPVTCLSASGDIVMVDNGQAPCACLLP